MMAGTDIGPVMFERFDAVRRITQEQALRDLPGSGGARYAEVFRHGSLQVEIYAPVGVDGQSAHTRDEVYIIAKASRLNPSLGQRSSGFEWWESLGLGRGPVPGGHRDEWSPPNHRDRV
jgi:hypothetical protein